MSGLIWGSSKKHWRSKSVVDSRRSACAGGRRSRYPSSVFPPARSSFCDLLEKEKSRMKKNKKERKEKKRKAFVIPLFCVVFGLLSVQAWARVKCYVRCPTWHHGRCTFVCEQHARMPEFDLRSPSWCAAFFVFLMWFCVVQEIRQVHHLLTTSHTYDFLVRTTGMCAALPAPQVG